MARSVTINIFGNDRASGAFRVVARDADRAADSIDHLGKTSSKAEGRFSALTGSAATMASGILAVAPAAQAAGAAMVAAAGAGAAAFASAGAALGAFQLAASAQLSSVAEAADLYAKAQEAAAEGGEKAAEAQKKYTAALAKMPPATRETAKAFIALKEEHKAWSDSLAGDTMPVFTSGLNVARKILPKLTPLVRTAAGALSDFMDGIERGVSGKGLDGFLSRMNNAAKESLPSLLRAAKNVGVGIAGIFDAFFPHAGAMSRGIEGLTEKFAAWGQSLRGSEQFTAFIGYVKSNLPALTTIFGNLVQIVGNLAMAMAPVSGISLQIVAGFTGMLAALPPELLRTLATGFIAVSLAMRVLNPLIAAMNVLMRLNPIGIVVLALAGLAAGLVIAYRRSETFRRIVDGAWLGIQAAASTAWGIIRPILRGLADGFQRAYEAWVQIMPSMQELIDNLVGKFGGIGSAAERAGQRIGTMGGGFETSQRKGDGFVKWMKSGAFGGAIGFGILGPLGLVLGQLAGTFWPRIKSGFGNTFNWIVKRNLSFMDGFTRDSDSWQGRMVGKFGSFFGRLQAKMTTGLPPLRANWRSFGEWMSAFSVNFMGVTRDAIDQLMDAGKRAFSRGVDAMGKAWGRLKSLTREPVNFVIGLYNNGIVALVNKLASFVGIKGLLGKVPAFASGGVMPGYAPGRDSLIAAVSPGESIFRPEFTRAVGPGFVAEANQVARRGGPSGVRSWLAGPNGLGGEGLAFAHGGIVPGFAGHFAFGGIIDDFVRGVRDFTIGNVDKGAETLLNKVLGGRVPGSGAFRNVVAGIPDWIKGAVLGWIKNKIKIGGPGVDRALAWAKGEAGDPYVWGGVGPHGYDCSGFMSAITNVIHGKSPHSRLFTTHSFGATSGPGGFVRGLRSGFTVGVTDAGVGHMAGTLAGQAVESSGSAGVRVGGGARGSNNSLFSRQYGLKFDEGGMLPVGWSTVYNGLGRPEPVFPSLDAAADYGRSDGPLVGEVHVHHVPGYSTPNDLMRGLRQAELEIRYHRRR